MLKEIRIQNFAIIENLVVNFERGLNVLTGETGAGKSIIIDALNLLLGGRADTDSIRTGETTALVEGIFQIANEDILTMAREIGVEADEGEFHIKRQISNSGKNRCFLNDSQITVSTLAKIGNRLVDLHGQHDHQTLLHPEIHVDLLDLFGKSKPNRDEFSKKFQEYQNLVKTLQSLNTDEQERLQREEFLGFQISEIDAANLSKEEEEELKAEKNKLRHSEKIRSALQQSQSLLSEQSGSILESLRQVLKELEPLLDVDKDLASPFERSQSAFYELEEVEDALRSHDRTLNFDPARLEEIEDRLAEINGLKRKYGNDVAEILSKRDKFASELEQLAGNEESMKQLAADIVNKEKIVSKLAVELADKREAGAKSLKLGVEKELKELHMNGVRFGVDFSYSPDPKGFVEYRKEKLKPTSIGLGSLEFLFSPNPGEELRPLAKIASGGELSRIMLALKSILNKQDTVPVMIFDEVDTGIGGRVAEKVGDKLKKVAKTKQVFCITHLPQIAGMASTHYRVEKQVQGKRTRSGIRQLEFEERVEELARMSSGEKITEASLKHARELIQPD
ncbi:MAG: DNA repair protein RecN [Nitrospina sp.]|jgi:DNA repair protein RecN (Recombination protein N)|nr:DNA repair protein RecN [Nitrospina sp.]